MRALQTRIGSARDRLKSILTGKPGADEELRVAVEHRLEAVIQAAAERAAERVSRSWREHAAGKALLEASPELGRGGASAGRHGGTGARLAGLRHGAGASRG